MRETTKRDWGVSVDTYCISAYVRTSKNGRWVHPGTASASRIGNDWWVNRVIVHHEDRGRHVGRTLVEMVKISLIDNHDEAKDGPLRVVVTPGGYDWNTPRQKAFYLSCGFRIVSDEPNLRMEWTPCQKDSTDSSSGETESKP